jgi:hypothetical protein
MSLAKKVKTALDETRLLILGAQVLFGFQLNGVFQEGFVDLSSTTKLVNCAGQALMVLSIALLIAPSMQHRITEGGEDTNRIHRVAGRYAGVALIPFGISLGIGFHIVFDHVYGPPTAVVVGSVFCILAGGFWFGLGGIVKARTGKTAMQEREEPTPLPAKVDQMLTEARVVLPGAQALLGFQFTVILTRSFESLPSEVKSLHLVALCCVAAAIVFLMTPAALHRISFGGEDNETFLRLGGAFVIAAPALLAFGIAGDLFVATYKASDSTVLAGSMAGASLTILAVFWFALPLLLRAAARFRPPLR